MLISLTDAAGRGGLGAQIGLSTRACGDVEGFEAAVGVGVEK